MKTGEKVSSQERIFIITDLLFKHHVSGLSNKELAGLTGTSEANICRDLAVFEQYKWVIRDSSAKWRLSPDFGSIAGHLMKSYQKAKLLLTEEEARYAAAMQ